MHFQLLISALALCIISITADENLLTPLEVLSKSSNKFTTQLFKTISSKNEGKNLISSPLSAYVALSMAAYGAGGYTVRQMRGSLNLPANTSLAFLGFQNLIKDLNNVKNVTLEVANKMYVGKDFKVKDAFKKLTKSVFQAEASEFDTSDPIKAAKTVNDWVDEKTHHKITDLINPSSITKNTRMILLNAIYFKGKWATPFMKKATTNLPFNLNKDTKVSVPTMFVRNSFVYGKLEDLKAQFIEIPYENEDVKMTIIMPNNVDDLKTVEQNFNDYSQIIDNAFEQKIRLFMPKFKIESELKLNEPLKELHMPNMFTDDANFNGISYEKVKVDQVKQKAFIEVNEEGSEAAAATSVVIAVKASFEPSPLTLHIDRPFYFSIRKSDTTLFQGHVYNPLK